MANMSPNKVAMPEQDPNVRNKNFKEGIYERNGYGRSNPLLKLQK